MRAGEVERVIFWLRQVVQICQNRRKRNRDCECMPSGSQMSGAINAFTPLNPFGVIPMTV